MMLHRLDCTTLFLCCLRDQHPQNDGDSTSERTVRVLANWIEVCCSCAKGILMNIPQIPIDKTLRKWYKKYQDTSDALLKKACWSARNFWRWWCIHMTLLFMQPEEVCETTQPGTPRIIDNFVQSSVQTAMFVHVQTAVLPTEGRRKKTKCYNFILLPLFWIG